MERTHSDLVLVLCLTLSTCLFFDDLLHQKPLKWACFLPVLNGLEEQEEEEQLLPVLPVFLLR